MTSVISLLRLVTLLRLALRLVDAVEFITLLLLIRPFCSQIFRSGDLVSKISFR